jgi:hypothetical protein
MILMPRKLSSESHRDLAKGLREVASFVARALNARTYNDEAGTTTHRKDTPMKKLVTSVVAASLLAGGALTGVAAAAPKAHDRSIERHSLKHESQSRDLRSHELSHDR